MKFYNIPNNYNFLESLYYFIIENFKNDIDLSSLIIFLPSRRSVNELKRIFIEKKSIIFVPTIKAIGDIDYDDIITNNLNIEILKKLDSLTKPVSNIRYKLLLINKFLNQDYEIGQAVNVADELNNFLNELEKNNFDLDVFNSINNEEYAIHWQKILDFLNRNLSEWKKFLEYNNIVSANKYKIQSIKYYIETFNNLKKLDNPIIIAGNLVSINTTFDLIKSLKKFDNSYFIFKGFDSYYDDNELKYIDELNNNFYFYEFIKKIKIDKNIIKNIKYDDLKIINDNDKNIIECSTYPYNLTYKWKKNKIETTINNIEYIETDNIFEEIDCIIFYILNFIKTNFMKNIAIITDINYCYDLENALKLYNITVNNNFGIKFSSIKLFNLIYLINNLIINDFRKDLFLGFLKNDYIKYNLENNLIKELEELILNNPINAINLYGYIHEAEINNKIELLDFLKKIKEDFNTFLVKDKFKIDEIIDLQFDLLNKILSIDNCLNSDENQKIIDYLNDFKKESRDFKEIDIKEYNFLLEYFLKQQSYNKEFSIYPAVNIINCEESRLINYDLVIIFNCNEGFIPTNISADPWLNNMARKKIGLQLKIANIGKDYYDFIGLISQKRVLITRSIKVNNNITFKSRFLQRLEGFLKCNKLSIKNNNEILEAVRYNNNEQNNYIKIKKPRPIYNLNNLEKRQISATNFDTLTKNPYDFYAKYILKLKNKNVLIDFQQSSLFGTIMHKIFENFTKNYSEYKDNIEELAESIINKEFYNNYILKKLNKQKFLLIAKNFYLLDKERRKFILNIKEEKEYKIFLKKHNLYLTAKIDRLELIENNMANIIDYKTGTAPNRKDIINGRKLQIPYTALIINKNNININNLEIWSIKYNTYSNMVINNKDNINTINLIIQNMEDFLYKIIDNFSTDKSEFIATSSNYTISDFNHLSRIDEWLYE